MSAIQRRLLIVDDEEPGRINLRYALAAHPDWQIAAECADAAATRVFLDTHDVDLVLLDIHMPHESGIQLARELAARPAHPLIVFVTAHDVHAVEAFTVHALDYLLKPVDDERLARALSRAEALIEQRQLAAHAQALCAWAASSSKPAEGARPAYLEHLNVRSIGRIDCVQLEEVMWIEAAGNYVELHMEQRSTLHRVPIGMLERRLDPACFMRVHRGALVRVDQVTALRAKSDGSWILVLRSGANVPVSARYLGTVKALLADG
jgi:two-component system, LytTR family, response regulator